MYTAPKRLGTHEETEGQKKVYNLNRTTRPWEDRSCFKFLGAVGYDSYLSLKKSMDTSYFRYSNALYREPYETFQNASSETIF